MYDSLAAADDINLDDQSKFNQDTTRTALRTEIPAHSCVYASVSC